MDSHNINQGLLYPPLAASPAAERTENESGEMTDPASSILLAFIVLAVKHTIADFFLQTPYQFRNKGIYGHPGGLLHSAIHVALTLPVFLLLPPATIMLALAIIAGEFAVHYHLDFYKERAIRRYGLTHRDPWFWRLFGIDQLAHLITYVVIIALLIE